MADIIVKCPDCGCENQFRDPFWNKEWSVKNSYLKVRYVGRCKNCDAPLHVNSKDNSEAWSTKTLIKTYGEQCLWCG